MAIMMITYLLSALLTIVFVPALMGNECLYHRKCQCQKTFVSCRGRLKALPPFAPEERQAVRTADFRSTGLGVRDLASLAQSFWPTLRVCRNFFTQIFSALL